MMILSPQSIIDVQWWYNKISCSKNNITKGEPVIEISSYASSFGWRAICNNIRTAEALNLDEIYQCRGTSGSKVFPENFCKSI